jgi:hypothetical protein
MSQHPTLHSSDEWAEIRPDSGTALVTLDVAEVVDGELEPAWLGDLDRLMTDWLSAGEQLREYVETITDTMAAEAGYANVHDLLSKRYAGKLHDAEWRALRELGFSQAATAALVGTTPKAIERREARERKPKPQVAEVIDLDSRRKPNDQATPERGEQDQGEQDQPFPGAVIADDPWASWRETLGFTAEQWNAMSETDRDKAFQSYMAKRDKAERERHKEAKANIRAAGLNGGWTQENWYKVADYVPVFATCSDAALEEFLTDPDVAKWVELGWKLRSKYVAPGHYLAWTDDRAVPPEIEAKRAEYEASMRGGERA